MYNIIPRCRRGQEHQQEPSLPRESHFSPRPEVTFILESQGDGPSIGYRTSMTCLHWLKAMPVFSVKRKFVRMGGKAPPWALYLCRSQSLWPARAWCWGRPGAANSLPWKAAEMPTPAATPRPTTEICVSRAGRFYKEKEHIKKRKRQGDYIATCCNESKMLIPTHYGWDHKLHRFIYRAQANRKWESFWFWRGTSN